MIYQIHNGAAMYGAETILRDINFEIKNDKEKIAIVGRNGCGKTTLLKLIAGEIDLVKRDSDEDIYIAKTGNPEIGYLKQMTFEDDSITLEDEVKKVFAPIKRMQQELDEMVARLETESTPELVKKYTTLQEHFNLIGGYYYEKEYEVVIKKFGFTETDKKKPIREFSGGQRTKIAFVKLLLEKPDILLLDEPTNHLDIETVEWLEGYLKDYPRAVVIVSHDRMFIDNICDVVYEIEYGKIKRYSGNYTKFMDLKREAYRKQLKDYTAQQAEIKRLETIVEKYKNTPSKVAMTRSKLKAIEHMEKIDCPDRYDTKSFKASFVPRRETGKDALFIKDLSVGYDKEIAVLKNLDMKRGEKIGIIGGNGAGKSTFLKTIVGAIKPLSGEFRYGVNTDIGYFDQQMAQYSSDKRLIDDYWDVFPTLTETEVRNDLGAFLFSGDDVFKQVNMLSGGEKVRLALCKMFKTGPNFLILDEPTNHMDIVGKETLESMLKDFEGSVIFVSHDRYFVKRVSEKVIDFGKDEVKVYQFGYDEYEEARKKALETDSFKTTKTAEEAPKKPQPVNIGKEKSKLNKKIEKIEAEIAELEAKIEAEKKELNDPKWASSYSHLTEIQGNIDKLEEELLVKMEEWGEFDKKLSEL
jgi:ATP-binding cassette subfamily F protein 3